MTINKFGVCFLEHNGETHTLNEWAKITGLSRQCIRARVKAGWDIERILNKPVQQWQKHYECHAMNYKDCFDCVFPECTREKPLKGEYRIMSLAHGEATRVESGEK